ncbi:hypothetical protein [Priestia megaterium]|uniref:hypothetical protein n=1 Tax=Priestia megaterium TaxID=1404 RepID=UPI0023D9E4F3|nr:hypothetical protein [Priestia megaterium]MDF2052605.1 hypothetical protein [Priestia megaterium]MDF2058727.1 hypothetical protein [Priestia megaterium]
MYRIFKLIIGIILVMIVLLVIIFINWQSIFGDNRPIANAKAIYQLEINKKDIAETTDVDNNILYLVPKGHLDTYIDMMKEKGYKLTEKDQKHKTLLIQKGNTYTEIYYKKFAKRYTIISSPFLKEV